MKKETENWWKQAKRDLESAKKIMELGEYHVCAFLSQQAVEKGLKALLIERTGNFPHAILMWLRILIKVKWMRF